MMNCSRKSRLALFLMAVVGLALVASPSHAQNTIDRLRLRNSIASGKITKTTIFNVEIDRAGVTKTYPAEEVISVLYAREPKELNTARLATESGKPRKALDLLEEINVESIKRAEIRSEVTYLRALAATQLALSGQMTTAAALKEVKQFLTGNRSSFHVLPAFELLGDLLVYQKKYEAARKEYAKLARADSTYYKLRSALLNGRAYQAEGQDKQAVEAFQKVVAATEEGPMIQPLKLEATLDLAVSEAASGNASKAIASLTEIIEQADPENDAPLLAQTYTALGAAHLKAGANKPALYAFLHVDLLYPQSGDQHARALYELSKLWKLQGHASRAAAAAKKLATRYPTSRWASR